jgi:predicted dehydrogenase
MGAHIDALLALKTEGHPVDIVAVADIYKPRVDAAVQRTGGKPYRDHRELLADPAVHVVGIASPDRHHAPQAIDAVLAGKDVYSEKPLTHWTQFEVVKKLAHLVEERKAVLQVGTQFVADSIYRQARQLIEEGAIGKPIHIQLGYFRQGDWGERGMPILDPNAKPGPDLDWEAFLGDAPHREFDVSRFFRWRMYLDYAGGPPTDLYPHMLTPLAIAAGLGFPTRVSAAGGKLYYNHEREVPDTVNILADYPQGVTLAVLGTQVNARGIETCVRGSEATLSFGGPGIQISPAGGGEVSREVAREQGGDTKEMWANLLECVRTRAKPWSDVRTQYGVQTTMNMAMLSLLEGKMAHFDAETEEIRL